MADKRKKEDEPANARLTQTEATTAAVCSGVEEKPNLARLRKHINNIKLEDCAYCRDFNIHTIHSCGATSQATRKVKRAPKRKADSAPPRESEKESASTEEITPILQYQAPTWMDLYHQYPVDSYQYPGAFVTPLGFNNVPTIVIGQNLSVPVVSNASTVTTSTDTNVTTTKEIEGKESAEDSKTSLNGSIFTSLTVPPERPMVRELQHNRHKFQQGRICEQQSNGAAYAPYPNVTDNSIRKQLLDIADQLNYLDCAFAWYFRKIIAKSDPENAKAQLKAIRSDFAKKQGVSEQARDASTDQDITGVKGSHGPNTTVDVYLGDLGQYCELVIRSHPSPQAKTADTTDYRPTRGSKSAALRYLQDAMEVPYWSFMLQEFGKWHAGSTGYTGETVQRALHSVKLELLLKMARLKADLGDGQAMENLRPILAGIEARIAVLDDIADDRLRGLTDVEDILLRCPCDGSLEPSSPEEVSTVNRTTSFSFATSISVRSGHPPIRRFLNLNAVFIFLIIATIPLCKGFALSMKKPDGRGSTHDPDFWYLLRDNVMWVLGSITVILSIKRLPWLSPAYLSMWMFLGTGLACGVVSVAIYTHVNTGWSNMLAFLASVASTAAVVVVAQDESEDVVVGPPPMGHATEDNTSRTTG